MRVLGTLVVAAVLALSACGDDDDSAESPGPPDRADAKAVVEQYLEASYSGDGETACALLTARGRFLLENAFAEFIGDGERAVSCEEGTALIAEAYGSEPSDASTPISKIVTRDGRVHVLLEGTSIEPELVVAGGEWRIDGGVEK